MNDTVTLKSCPPCPICRADASWETALTANIGGKEIIYGSCSECSCQAEYHDWLARSSSTASSVGADAADLLAHYADFIRHSVKADELEAHPYLPEIERVVDDLRAATTAWNTRDGGAATPMREAGTASSVGADVVEDCTACERLGGVDCGEHVPSWEQLAIYWRTRALQAPSRAVPAEPSDEEVERAIDDGLVTRFRSAPPSPPKEMRGECAPSRGR